jgi:hypothetical protein
MEPYPEEANSIPGTIRGPIRLDHAKHPMKLPADEEGDEQVVGVPKPLKMCTAATLHREPDHYCKACSHDPASDPRPSGEVCREEDNNTLPSCFGINVGFGEHSKVEHVRRNVNNCPHDDRPSRCLVKGNALVKGNNVVERGPAEERDEIPADWKKDEDNIHVENQGGRASKC